MTDEEIEHHAIALQQATPSNHAKASVLPWTVLKDASKDYWREKVRRGERAPVKA